MSATVSSILDLDPEPPGGPAAGKAEPVAPGPPAAAVRSGAAEPTQGQALSDEELLQRYRSAADEQAFRTLYGRYRPRLYRFVLRLSRDRHEADEVFQETWMAVVKAKEQTAVRFAAYLFSIAHRRLVDRWRRRKRWSALEMDGSTPVPDPDELADDLTLSPDAWAHLEQLRDALAGEFAKLPVLQREVFLMKAEADLSLEEIAAVMGATQEATKSRLRYALRRLREALGVWK